MDHNTFQWVGVTVLGILAYFLKKVLNNVEDLNTKVHELQTSVAVILDRDRRRRIKDYAEDDKETET